MTQGRWVRRKLEENSFDNELIYKNCWEEFHSTYKNVSYSTFQRLVRSIHNKYSKTVNGGVAEQITKKLGALNIEDVYSIINYVQKLKDIYGEKWNTILTNFIGNINEANSELLEELLCLADNGDLQIEDFKDNIKVKSNLIHSQSVIYKLKKEIKNLYSKHFEQFNMVEAIKEASKGIKINDEKLSLSINILPKPIDKSYNNVLLFGDLHYQETTSFDETSGINQYNCGIARDRITRLFEENLRFSLENNCEKLYIFMLGDMLNGQIHDEFLESNEGTINEKLIELKTHIMKLLMMVVPKFKYVEIVGVSGNHGRYTPDVRYTNKAINNWDNFLYNLIKFDCEEKFKNSSTKVIVRPGKSSGSEFCQVGESWWNIQHGDNYKGGNAAAIAKNLAKDIGVYDKIGQEFDIVCMGHFHIPSLSIESAEKCIIINGNMNGANSYSIVKMHSAISPSQYSFICDENRIKYTYLIPLKEIRK